MITIFKGLGKKETFLNTRSPYSGSSRDYDAQDKEYVGSLTYSQMSSMYEVNPIVRACIDAIKDKAASVEPIVKAIVPKGRIKPTDGQLKRIEKIQKLIQKPNSQKESFESLMLKVFWDILVYDAGSMEWLRDLRNKEIVEMFAVDGSTIRLNVGEGGMFITPDIAYRQVDTTEKTVAEFKMEDLCYLVRHPRSRSVYGISSLETLVQTVTAELYASNFNIQRFINDASPKLAVLVSGAGMQQGGEVIRRFQQYWRRELQGQPHKPIFLSTDTGTIDIQRTGLTNEEMQYQQYSQWLLQKIAAIYKVPPFVLGIVDGTTGKLNSKQQDLLFKKSAIFPLLKAFSHMFNREVIWDDVGYNYDDIYMHWEGIDIEDIEALSKIHETYLRTGVYTINMVLNELGFDGVPWGDVPYLQKQYVPIGFNDNTNPPKETTKLFESLGIESGELNQAITTLLNKREQQLNKFFMIPSDIGLKNVAEEV